MLDTILSSLELGPDRHEPSPAEERRFDMRQSVAKGLQMITDAYPQLVALGTVVAEERLAPPSRKVDYVPDTTDRSVEGSQPAGSSDERTPPAAASDEGLSVQQMQAQVQAAFETGPANPLFESQS